MQFGTPEFFQIYIYIFIVSILEYIEKKIENQSSASNSLDNWKCDLIRVTNKKKKKGSKPFIGCTQR